MMKKFLLSVLATLAFLPLFGQITIPNSGFETWVSAGQYDEPEHWSTFNSTVSPPNLPFAVMTSDANSGNAAILMTTQKIGSFFLNGQVTGRFAASARPAVLTGFYKYHPAGVDTCKFLVQLVKFNPVTLSDSIIGQGMFESAGTGNGYTPFTIPITYTSFDMPDTMMVIMVPGTNPLQPGSELKVDDLAAHQFFVGLSETVKTNLSLSLYPNPCHQHFAIIVPEKVSGTFDIEITNALGQPVLKQNYQGKSASEHLPVDVSALANGMYTIRLKTLEKNYQNRLIISK